METTRNAVISANIPGIKLQMQTDLDDAPEGVAIIMLQVDGFGILSANVSQGSYGEPDIVAIEIQKESDEQIG